MTAPIIFEKPALMRWNEAFVTDHNRGALSVNPERIETSKRMANGTLRKYIVAVKKKFSVSWNAVPHSKDYTVDGFWGGREIEEFFETVPGPFTLRVTNGDGQEDEYRVMITNFSKELAKRGLYDFWDIQIEMDEV